MTEPCRESDLEALLGGALPAPEAARVEAHAAACAGCARTLAWLKLEGRWMAQRARRSPDRKSTRLNSSHSGESRMPSSA